MKYRIRLSRKTAMSIRLPDTCVLSLLLSSQNARIASGWGDETVRVWNIPTGQSEWVVTAHYNFISMLGSSGDDRWNEEPFYAAGKGRRWITYGGRNVLALPREFRRTGSRYLWPNESTGSTLAFTGDSGRPAIFAFDGAPDFERSNLAH